MNGPGPAVEVIGLRRSFGETAALDGIDLTVPRGTVLGLLGHNGAGKSTLVNVLTTLLRPTGGTARVAGHDVVEQAARVRRSIGLAGQHVTLDLAMSARDNLILAARLWGAGRRQARERAGHLLEVFGLTAAADRPARSCSGGMRRRLDLAVTFTRRPEVVFLDEPGTGLDPVSRLGMWDMVRGLTRAGSTVVLTTQHLEEADHLADSITVLAEGRVVASGTPADLKARVGRRTVEVRCVAADDVARAGEALHRAGLRPECDPLRRTVTAVVTRERDLAAMVRALDAAAVEPTRLTLAEPGLDQVYLALVGHGGTEDFR
ncbi:ABC-2 type transport system ATP-binding protein [Thermomonospora echinospora]|uniref:ABC-2 type transport system ATP-binding protein n=1 Tax=Thermomonospora echinospora TaxID=1992 RepID=A0A1H6DK38_9ACTN|nr:ATP-binding cassette domain-containing protein [Thermomonospora echinospora]SEG85554.1 ABC-2 type transport system ATP-binding protein [Thermomonospora echinospora]